MSGHDCLNFTRVPDKLGNFITGETLVYRCAGCRRILEVPHAFLEQLSKPKASMPKHNPLCQQAMDIDPDVPNCICDWVDAAERDTEARIIKLLEDNYPHRLAGIKALIKGEK